MDDEKQLSLEDMIAAEDEIPGGFRVGQEKDKSIFEDIDFKTKYTWAKNVIESEGAYKHAGKALKCLNKLKDMCSDIFMGENIYIWEDLARIFDTMDDLNNAAYCFRAMAQLGSERGDPYLNLGTLLHSRGYVIDAIKAYKDGLQVNPDDEYIYYNLSSLFMQEGMFDSAIKTVNAAILENPERAINFMLKGDIHFNRHDITRQFLHMSGH